jgi:hypothetical protein
LKKNERYFRQIFKDKLVDAGAKLPLRFFLKGFLKKYLIWESVFWMLDFTTRGPLSILVVFNRTISLNQTCGIKNQSAVGTVNIVAADFNPPEMRPKD